MYQPTDREAADMFRVMMTEMLKMHPVYRELEDRFGELYQDFKAGNIKKNHILLRHHINRIHAVFKELEND